MRTVPILVVLALCGCGAESSIDAPPLDRLYFPTGLVHAAGPTITEPGTLYVASSDFDKRYDFGAVTAISLGELDWTTAACADGVTPNVDLRRPWYLVPGSMPPAAPNLPCAPSGIANLKLAEANRVLTAPFAGVMGAYPMSGSQLRLFVPTRSEGDRLHIVEADGAALSCFGGTNVSDCTAPGLAEKQPSLTAQARAAGDEGADGFEDGKPRAPGPYAATVADGRVYVTHLQQADSPIDSQRNRESYLVTLDAADPVLSASSFLPIGNAPSTAVSVGARYAYVSGRTVSNTVIAPPVRLVERGTDGTVNVLVTNLEDQFNLLDTRGLVVHRPAMGDETRAYLIGRFPDVLLVMSIANPRSDTPSVQLLHQVPLPEGPNDLKLIERPGRPPLLAISCSSAGSVAIYDDETQQLATLVEDVGLQPFSVVADQVPGAAGVRLYVSNFGDGRIAVVDIPDINTPSKAILAAHLGQQQLCLTAPDTASTCSGEIQ